MDHHHHKTEVTGRRTLFNGLVTAATRSWRHGLQPNGGHTSNAMVFPTISTAASPTCRTSVVDNSTTTEEQRRRLQQQRHRDHRLNVLWYGGDDSHQQQQQCQLQQQQGPTLHFESQNHRYQSTDDWEKRPLRQRRRKSQRRSRHRRNRINKRPSLPTVPVIWAAVLLAVYATSMAMMYHVYGAVTGSGWMWLKGVAGYGPLRRLSQLSPTRYYAVQAFCAVVIGCFWWSSQHQQRRRRRWCCYVLLVLFVVAICPSLPLVEIFGVDGGDIVRTENSTVYRRQQKQSDNDYFSGDLNDNHRRLAMYEGLWQVTFFVFVAYCLILPTGIDDELENGNNETIENGKRNGDAKNSNEKTYDVTTAVLLFSTLVSIGHTSLNAYSAYRWYFQQRYDRDNNLAAIQQVSILYVHLVIVYNSLLFFFLHSIS